MPPVNWNFLLDNLEDRKCILCLGPDIFNEPQQPRFEQRLAAFLRQHAEDLRVSVYDNGWFHYRKGHNKSSVWKKLDEFFKTPHPQATAIVEQLAGLPFEVVISFSPDYLVRNIMAAQRPGIQFRSFVRNLPCKDVAPPTIDNPLVFNMLGELSNGNSLVLTYQDAFGYFKSVFDEQSIPIELQEKISDAQHFIFLGMPFDRWYTHLFMSVINTYVDVSKEKEQSIHRVAANPFLDTSDMEHSAEQYALTYVPNGITDFVAELHRRCAEKGFLIGNAALVKPLSIFDQWHHDIRTGDPNRLLKVLDDLAEYIVEHRNQPDSVNAVTLLTGQYNRFLSEKRRGRFETRKAEAAAEAQIVDGVLSLISGLEFNKRG